ncbi:MAG: protein translocase subunit SecD [Patescibacteria group bacterium]
MLKYRIWSVILILLVILVGLFVYKSETLSFENSPKLAKYAFKLGLDLNGGTELTYRAVTEGTNTADIEGSMATLRDVIEKRVNVFGVSEPVVRVENPSSISGREEYRLLVELPGVTDIDEAVAMIGKTPQLEFKLVNPAVEGLSEEELKGKTNDELFLSTGLNGKYLERADLQFTTAQTGLAGEPIVSITFNEEGRVLFSSITKNNLNKVLAIFLDGELISGPVIRDEITDGKATISGGGTTAEEAKALVRNLNYGALPLPIELVSTQTVGASLGENAKTAGVKAGIIGFIFVGLFMILWYRLPGLVATVAMSVYILLSLALFKLVPVTLTAAGIAGFILSIGMAVDANVLIFERMKEELKKGKGLYDAMNEGFSRAWLSIRDSNISSMITAVVLFWLGTSAIKGFALAFGLGVLVSMFTAITVSRTFLFAVSGKSESKLKKFLFGSGIGA